MRYTFLHHFSTPIDALSLPEKFTYPHYYSPHPLAVIAAQELQQKIQELQCNHNFGLAEDEQLQVPAIGKMFGVLVVQQPGGKLGYLGAFSGKLGNRNHHDGFVPPVFDTLDENGFYKKGEAQLNILNTEIEAFESSKEFQNQLQLLDFAKKAFEKDVNQLKLQGKEAKQQRKQLRQLQQALLSESDYAVFSAQLDAQSAKHTLELKKLTRTWSQKIHTMSETLYAPLIRLKTLRASLSAQLQQQLFESYTFLNFQKESRNLLSIFSDTAFQRPPSGAGECAAPKLLQYAFQENLKPICMAEFWWGKSPDSEIRVHQQFYPACRGKCEPILKFMLQGIPLDENPMETQAKVDQLELVFEDDSLVLFNKPADFLSVPGKTLTDSVLTRAQKLFPAATGPLLVHRLDMSTSGLILMAKNQKVHKALQKQFIHKTISKRYVALLQGELIEKSGLIDIPLTLDVLDRPKQKVCFETGKVAKTKFEVIEVKNGITKVYFYPITGRTHQLRVHAAHTLGLNSPILGDDLYGTKSQRLYLHAERLTFFHPVLQKEMTVFCPSDF
jgi:tRNA pseudouridine32 synthase/23S rRNA pseudouridine746 synthase